MAEYVFKDIVKKEGLDGEFLIKSAATSSEEIGNPVYPPAMRELLRHGITCTEKRAVKLVKSDYDKYDYIIGMEEYNIRNIMRIFGGDPKNKVKKLLDYGTGGDIADPWYTGDFELTYSQVSYGCSEFLKYLKKIEKI